MDDKTLDTVRGLLRRAERILFITGAGISAESGLPTYRGVGGIYTGEAAAADGMPVEELASAGAFETHPETLWRYLARMEEMARGASCNEAHRAIAAMESDPAMGEVWVLTQNVDGLHRAAGSHNVIEIHGNLHRLRCTACDWNETVDNYGALGALPPHCPRCASVLRPDVILFGEMLPLPALALLEAQQARGFDLVFSVGTTSLFPYIAQPVLDARREGVPTVEINPERSDVSALVDYRLQATAVQAMTRLLNSEA